MIDPLVTNPSAREVIDTVNEVVEALSGLTTKVDRPLGIATLDVDGRLVQNINAAKIVGTISAGNLPSYVDDVLEFANLAALPATGETGKIYVALDTSKTYRWSGSVYVAVGADGDLFITYGDAFADVVLSGLVFPTSATLTSTMTSGVAEVIGTRVVVPATANTFTASQDTYVDLSKAGVLTYLPVALNAAAPAVTVNSLRLQKVVTSATGITSVVQLASRELTANRNVSVPAPTLGGHATNKDFVSAELSAHNAAADPHTGYALESTIGVANGIAGLDGTGKVPAAQLPSYVDDVLEYAGYAALPATGETGKIYITQDTGASYRWTGTVYLKLSDDDVLQFANLAAFPVSGVGAALYIAADTGLLYRWDGAAYATVGGGGGGAAPVAQVDATVDGSVIINAGTTSLDFTGAYSSTKTIDCVNIADGATVAIHSINGIGTVTLSGTGLTFTGSLSPFDAGYVGTLTRNGNVVHAAEPESVLNKVYSIVEPISIVTGFTQYPSLIATSVHTNRRLKMQDVLYEFVVSGFVLTKITGRDAALSEGVVYVGGTMYQHERIAIPAVASRTYTASKDTYVDIRNTNYGTYQIEYTIVNNGAAAPTLHTNAYRIYKVVTDATDITSIENLARRQPTFKAPITVPDAVVAGDAVNKGQLDAASVQSITIVCSDETTALTVGAAKVTLRMPYAFTLQKVRASLSTAQTSGVILTIDVNDGISSVLSTKLTIDNTEKTSTTAAIPAVISDTALADDAEITIDIDQIGDGTAKGLKVYLIGVKA